jgi:hypothetical protein
VASTSSNRNLKTDASHVAASAIGRAGRERPDAGLGYANQLASQQANQLLQIRGSADRPAKRGGNRMQAEADKEAQQQGIGFRHGRSHQPQQGKGVLTMTNMLRTAALVVLASAVLVGCGKSEDEALNKRTPEQQEKADKLYDMGGPTDRNKSKGY